MNVLDFKKGKNKITMITCYDHWTASILNKTDIDCLLVGDSLAMIIYGKDSTLDVSTQQIAYHVEAVKKGAPDKFIVGDLPFLSYRKGLATTMNNVEKLMKAGANAVKLEGALGNLKTIKHIVDSGVPVMGHLGLTPQMVHQMGGYKVQGKTDNEANKIITRAKELEEAGCFSLVLECIPTALAQKVTDQLSIPTIGIGAGSVTDGQVIVLQDMLGAYSKNAKFVRKYAELNKVVFDAVNKFHEDVNSKSYPGKEESYS